MKGRLKIPCEVRRKQLSAFGYAFCLDNKGLDGDLQGLKTGLILVIPVLYHQAHLRGSFTNNKLTCHITQQRPGNRKEGVVIFAGFKYPPSLGQWGQTLARSGFAENDFMTTKENLSTDLNEK